jgi:hypothetical protein
MSTTAMMIMAMMIGPMRTIARSLPMTRGSWPAAGGRSPVPAPELTQVMKN